ATAVGEGRARTRVLRHRRVPEYPVRGDARIPDLLQLQVVGPPARGVRDRPSPRGRRARRCAATTGTAWLATRRRSRDRRRGPGAAAGAVQRLLDLRAILDR